MKAIHLLFRDLNRSSTTFVIKEMPDTAAASTGEQPHLTGLGLAPQMLQHAVRV
jgi:hypothetical protein